MTPDIHDSDDQRTPIRRALVSVHDKTGLDDLARALADAGVEIVSTGSTAARIAEAGVPVTPVERVTGFPEVLDGRVKTLHPLIHSAILADRRKASHRSQLNELGVTGFDLVVCSLYPFEETVARGEDFDACVEQIDIGGPSMIRAAAKNHASVAVITSTERYEDVRAALAAGGFTAWQRRELAAEAFVRTAGYDLAIADWFVERSHRPDLREALEGAVLALDATARADEEMPAWFADHGGADLLPLRETHPDAHVHAPQTPVDGEEDDAFPEVVGEAFVRVDTLRYGENPHQNAAVYRVADRDEDETCSCGHASEGGLRPGLANARQLHGKAMSYNNYTDGDAAWRAAWDHEEPCVAIIKHANPCGIAIGSDVAEAHRKAHACDPVSAFGGVIAVNRPVSVALAHQIVPIFTEVVLAPGYEDGALEVLATKKNLRVLEVAPPAEDEVEFRQISGGLLVQERDALDAPGDDPSAWTLVAGEPADDATLRDLTLAWRSVRAVRSNAIILVREGASVGVGMGQVNRVDSCRLAVERANTLGGRSTGDAAADVNSAGGARAEDVIGGVPEERARGAVAASDAFFPFADGLQVLIDAGVKAVVQPGGSVRDEESIAAARAAGVTMYLTGTRHFAH